MEVLVRMICLTMATPMVVSAQVHKAERKDGDKNEDK